MQTRRFTVEISVDDYKKLEIMAEELPESVSNVVRKIIKSATAGVSLPKNTTQQQKYDTSDLGF